MVLSQVGKGWDCITAGISLAALTDDTQHLLLPMLHTVLLSLHEREDAMAASHLPCWHDSCCPLLV